MPPKASVCTKSGKHQMLNSIIDDMVQSEAGCFGTVFLSLLARTLIVELLLSPLNPKP